VSEVPWPSLRPSWEGQAAVVTGVGRAGQAGAVVARAFAEHGAVVHCIDRDASVRDRAAELTALGFRAVGHVVDLADADAVGAAAATIAAQHAGQIHAVAAVAGGFGVSGPVASSDPELHHRQMLINATSAWTTARAFAPAVRAARGAFVFVSSPVVQPGAAQAGLVSYAMAKGAILPLVRTLAVEESPHGVRVNAVAPAALRTDANVDAMGEQPRYVEREEFATVIVALCSPAWRRVTGQLIELA